MTDRGSPAMPGLVGDQGSTSASHAAAHAAGASHYGNMDHVNAVFREAAFAPPSPVRDHASRIPPASSAGNVPGRDQAAREGVRFVASSSSDHHAAAGDSGFSTQLPNTQHLALSRSNSQGTSSTNGADPVFTPPVNGARLSPGSGSAHDSSQESQLLQLSQIAAAQERIPEASVDAAAGASRKRMADGMVKHTRTKSNVSPGQMPGHARTTSAVSVASTSGSRIGEVSAELKARLSYAMVKVNHGWQSHSIDQVETLASQAASPASTASTIHLRSGSSTSPQLSSLSRRGSTNTAPVAGPQHQHASQPGHVQWGEFPQSTSRGSSTSPVKTLAPPVSIQPFQQPANPRREPNPRQVPAFLSSSHQTSPRAGLHTSPYLAPGRHRSAMSEAMLVSPHTNVREQDAIESLLFMSSPGNSANLKHAFPSSSSQPLPSGHTAPSQQRHALPTSQPRKSLPSGRPSHPNHHARSQSQSQPQSKRVGFDKSPPTPMDLDDAPPAINLPYGSPMSVSRGTPARSRRPQNGDALHPHSHSSQPQPSSSTQQQTRLKQLPVSSGLTVASRPRPKPLGDAEIDAMLERAAKAAEEEGEDSDEGEIRIPVQRARREGAGVVGV